MDTMKAIVQRGSILVDYSMKLDLDGFMEKNYQRRILEEKLFVNEKEVFTRNENLTVKLPSVIKEYVNKSIKRRTPKMLEIAESSLKPAELFLSNGFKSIYAGELVETILNWFDEKFMVIYRSDAVKTMRSFADPKENSLNDRTQYLSHVNQAFGEKFENLDQYKHENRLIQLLG